MTHIDGLVILLLATAAVVVGSTMFVLVDVGITLARKLLAWRAP